MQSSMFQILIGTLSKLLLLTDAKQDQFVYKYVHVKYGTIAMVGFGEFLLMFMQTTDRQ